MVLQLFKSLLNFSFVLMLFHLIGFSSSLIVLLLFTMLYFELCEQYFVAFMYVMSSNAMLTAKKIHSFLDLFLGHGNDKSVELILSKIFHFAQCGHAG